MGAGGSVGTVAVLSGGALLSSTTSGDGGGQSKGSDATGNGRQSVHSHIPKQDGLPPIQTEPRYKRERELEAALILMKRNW